MTLDFSEWAQSLLLEWEMVRKARPKSDLATSVDLECSRESLNEWESLLRRNLFDKQPSRDLAEACYQFESRLKKYKEKVILEALNHGSI